MRWLKPIETSSYTFLSAFKAEKKKEKKKGKKKRKKKEKKKGSISLIQPLPCLLLIFPRRAN